MPPAEASQEARCALPPSPGDFQGNGFHFGDAVGLLGPAGAWVSAGVGGQGRIPGDRIRQRLAAGLRTQSRGGGGWGRRGAESKAPCNGGSAVPKTHFPHLQIGLRSDT